MFCILVIVWIVAGALGNNGISCLLAGAAAGGAELVYDGAQ